MQTLKSDISSFKNSTSESLGANQVFTGTSQTVFNFNRIDIRVKTDVVSASNGLSLEFSPDGTNWTKKDQQTISNMLANNMYGVNYSQYVLDKYFRLVYTNGPTAQNFLSIQTVFSSQVENFNVSYNSVDNTNKSLSCPGFNYHEGTVVSCTTTTIELGAGASSTDDEYNDQMIEITSGTGKDTFRKILDYNGTSKTVTVSELGELPNIDSTYVVHRQSGCLDEQNFNGRRFSVKLSSHASSVDDFYTGQLIRIIKNGINETRYVKGYDGTTKILKISEDWSKRPETGDHYVITGESDTAVSATSNTVTTNGNHSDSVVPGLMIEIVKGTGIEQNRTIQSISGNVITVDSDWTTALDNTSFYRITTGWSGEYESVESYSNVLYNMSVLSKERVVVTTNLSPDKTKTDSVYNRKSSYDSNKMTHTLSAKNNYFKLRINGVGTSITGLIQTSKGTINNETTVVSETITDSTDCNVVRAVIAGKSEDNGKYKNINTDFEGNLNVNIMQPRDNFGHIVTAEPRVMSELKFPYATTHYLQEYFFRGSGGFVHTTGILTPTTGTSQNSLVRLCGVHRNYDAGGLSMKIRFSAFFSDPAAGCEQIIGYGDQNNGYFMGYNGTEFGVLRRSGGRSEIRILQIISGASSTGDVSVELDGESVNVPVVSGDTKYEVARKIATGVLAAPTYLQNEYAGISWKPSEDNDMVYFHSENSGPRSGSYSISGQGVVGGFVQYQEGISSTDDWTMQSSWNVDRLDETVSLPVIDFKKGNMFEIDHQWLGFGNISFKIQNPTNGNFSTIHEIMYTNTSTLSNIEVPHQPLMMEVNNGTTSNNVSLSSASMVSLTLGINNIYNATRFGDSVIKKQTLKSGKRYNIMTLRNNTVLMGTTNVIEMLGLTIANSWNANSSAIFHTLVNAELDHSLDATVTAAGTGYSVGDNITTTGGTGSGMTVNITSVGGSGEVTGIVIKNHASGYLKDDVLTLQSGNTDCTITLENGGLSWVPRKQHVSSADVCKDPVEVTGGEEHFSISMGPNTRFFEAFNEMEIFMPPWYTLTLAMEPLDDEIDAEFSCSFFWSEKI